MSHSISYFFKHRSKVMSVSAISHVCLTTNRIIGFYGGHLTMYRPQALAIKFPIIQLECCSLIASITCVHRIKRKKNVTFRLFVFFLHQFRLITHTPLNFRSKFRFLLAEIGPYQQVENCNELVIQKAVSNSIS